jgi:hypothetical protein
MVDRLKASCGGAFEDDNKLAYYRSPKTLHIGPDKVLSGPPALREILSDPWHDYRCFFL